MPLGGWREAEANRLQYQVFAPPETEFTMPTTTDLRSLIESVTNDLSLLTRRTLSDAVHAKCGVQVLSHCDG